MSLQTFVIVAALAMSALIYGLARLEQFSNQADDMIDAPLDDRLPDTPLGKAVDPEFPPQPNAQFYDDPGTLAAGVTWCGICSEAVPVADIDNHLGKNCPGRI
jgi:hypothetical protein